MESMEGLWGFTARFYPRLKSVSGHAVRPNPELVSIYPGIRFFVFVRDPLERAISHYLHFVERGAVMPPAEEWFRKHSNILTKGLCGEGNAQRAIDVVELEIGFVGLVEKFDESLILWGNWFGSPEFDLRYQTVNAARNIGLKEELLARRGMRELLEDLHEEDRRFYRYCVEVVYGRQVDRFPGSLVKETEKLRNGLADAPKRSLKYCFGKVKTKFLYNPSIRMRTAFNGRSLG